jgi:hypothetical protein
MRCKECKSIVDPNYITTPTGIEQYLCKQRSSNVESTYVSKDRPACEDFKSKTPKCLFCGSDQVIRDSLDVDMFYLFCGTCLARGPEEKGKKRALEAYVNLDD